MRKYMAALLVALVLVVPTGAHAASTWGVWRPVPRSMVGDRADLVLGRTARIGRLCLWRPADTTFIICPNGNIFTS